MTPAADRPDEDRDDVASALGAFIREQRNAAHLSLRALADKAGVSNPYLSQIERGLHEPSVRVLTSIASALISIQSELADIRNRIAAIENASKDGK